MGEGAARADTVGTSGRPADLAGAVIFFATRASDYITGQIIYVDGGFLAGWPDRTG